MNVIFFYFVYNYKLNTAIKPHIKFNDKKIIYIRFVLFIGRRNLSTRLTSVATTTVLNKLDSLKESELVFVGYNQIESCMRASSKLKIKKGGSASVQFNFTARDCYRIRQKNGKQQREGKDRGQWQLYTRETRYSVADSR